MLDTLDIQMYIHCRQWAYEESGKRCEALGFYNYGRTPMPTDDFEALFAGIREFGWNPKKRENNLRQHKIDFEDAKGIFDGYTFIRRSDRHGEVRYQIFGYVQGREVAVACTFRGPVCRIISARPARRDERRRFYNRLEGQP